MHAIKQKKATLHYITLKDKTLTENSNLVT